MVFGNNTCCFHSITGNLIAAFIGIRQQFRYIFHEVVNRQSMWISPLCDPDGMVFTERLCRIRGYRCIVSGNTPRRLLRNCSYPMKKVFLHYGLHLFRQILQVSVQSWMGTGIVKIKQRAHRSALREIVNTMNEYFRTLSVSTNIIPCIFFLVIGIFEVLFVIAMFFFLNHVITLSG